MRLQLITRASGGLVVAAMTLQASAARAEDRVDFKTTYFLEPAAAERLHIVHPQLDVSVDATRSLSLRVGYEADIVSGATPRTYSVDTVSTATKFSDLRHAVRGGLEMRVGPVTIDGGYTYAFEKDYLSHAVDAAARVDLWGKNTSFQLGYAHNFDSVCNIDNRGASPLERRSLSTSDGCFKSGMNGLIDEALAIDSYTAAVTQVLLPTLLADVSVSFQTLDGFQSNPYRRVRLFSGTVEAQESEPLLRQRVAVQARLRWALPRLRSALGALGRYYWDTWDVRSITAELAWEQYLASALLVRLRGRFYQQSRALFYRDAGEALSYEAVGPVGQYFTGDRELSPFRDYLVGAKVALLMAADERGKVLRWFQSLDLNVKLDLVKYEALTPLPPNKSRSDALIGAIVMQFGLQLRW